MKILVRVDVSRAIGTGHWRRMSNLLEAMQGAEGVFLVRTDDPGNSLFAGSGARFLEEADEVEAMRRLCASEQIDLVLVDLLNYPAGYLAGLKSRLACKVVSFHEYPHPGGVGDLGVNYNTFDGFESAGSSSFLAGPAYIIVNRELVGTKRAAETRGVLVSFGGSDPSGFTEAALRRVVPLLPELPFIIHSGPFSSAIAGPSLETTANLQYAQPGSFFNLLASCQIVVTAAGNAMYEAMFLGMVPLLVAHNPHQAEFARNAARYGACQYFGMHPAVDWPALTDSLRAHYAHPLLPPCRLVDGQGAERLAASIKQLYS